MRAFSLSILLILLLAGGAWWFTVRGGFSGETPPSPGQATPTLREPPLSAPRQDRAEEAPMRQDGIIAAPFPGEAGSPVVLDDDSEPQYVFDALSWLKDYRTTLARISKARAIAEGRYILGEEEETIDLRGEYAALHARLDHVGLPKDRVEEWALVMELDAALRDIVDGLSAPPLGTELEMAAAKRAALEPSIRELLALLHDQ